MSVATSFRAVDRQRRVAAAVLAGGVAYNIYFWLLAIALLGGGGLGFFQEASLEDALKSAGIPGGVVQSIANFAHDSGAARWWLLLLGGYLTLWSGYTGSKATRLVHALIWDEPSPKPVKRRYASLVFNAVCLGVGLVIAGSWWLRQTTTAGAIMTVIALVVPLTALWVVVSLLLPHRDANWWALIPGALLVAVGFQVLHVITLWFALPRLESPHSTYGTLGVAATLLSWGYLVGRLIVSAAIMNASLYDERRSSTREARNSPTPDAPTAG